jgi:hypothetical protein
MEDVDETEWAEYREVLKDRGIEDRQFCVVTVTQHMPTSAPGATRGAIPSGSWIQAISVKHKQTAIERTYSSVSWITEFTADLDKGIYYQA